ncbi:MAG: hypothetical protein JWN50_343 [Parcubacteria group bacterium]|nr:hypothetical protein [Parcubacteria group bacterium]
MQTRNISIERLARIVLLITVFLVPFFFIPSQSVTLDTAKTLLLVSGVFISLSLYLVSVVKKGEFEFPSTKALWAVILIPAAFLASALLSGNAHVGLVGYNLEIGTVAFVALGFVLMFLTAVFFKTKERIYYTYLGFLAAFVIVALIALVKFFFGAGALSLGTFTGTAISPVGSWTDAAVFFGCSLVVVTIAFEELLLSTRGKFLLGLAFIVSLFSIAVLNVSVVWIGLMAFSLIYLLYTFSFNSPITGIQSAEPLERRISYTALALLLVSLLFVFNPTVSSSGARLGDALSQKFNVSNIEVSPSMSATVQVVRPVVKDNPIFGSGPNTFDIDWFAHKPAAVNSSIFWNTPFPYGVGILPTFVATTGTLGAVLWLLFLVFFILLGVRAIFVRKEDKVGRFLLTSSFVVSLFLWLLFLAYVPSKAIFALSFVTSGLFFASATLSGAVARKTILFRNNSKLAFVAVLLLVAVLVGNVAFAYTAVKQSVAAIYFGKASVAASASDITLARNDAQKAATLSGQDIYYSALAQIGIAQTNAVLNTATGTPESAKTAFQNSLAGTIAAAQAATQARPEVYQNWIALGAIYESLVPAPFSLQGAYDSAKAAYTEAEKRNPESPEPYFLLARLEVANKNNAAARDLIKQALAKKADYADAYNLLAQIEIADGNTAEAIKAAESLAILAPNNAGVLFEVGVLKYNAADYQGAADALSAALAVSSDYANAMYFYGLDLVKLGRKDEALAEFQKLLAANPTNAELPQIIANIQAGKDPLFKIASASATSDTTTPAITNQKTTTPAH